MKFKFIKAALVGLVLTASSIANAGLIINIVESSGNVEMSYSGSINLNALLGSFNTDRMNTFSGIVPFYGNIGIGGRTDVFSIDLSQPRWLSIVTDATEAAWDTISGEPFALFSNPVLGLVAGYESGDPTAGAATKLNSSFAALGLTTGTYLSTVSNGDMRHNLDKRWSTSPYV